VRIRRAAEVLGKRRTELLGEGEQHLVLIVEAVLQEGHKLVARALRAERKGNGADAVDGVEPQRDVVGLELVDQNGDRVERLVGLHGGQRAALGTGERGRGRGVRREQAAAAAGRAAHEGVCGGQTGRASRAAAGDGAWVERGGSTALGWAARMGEQRQRAAATGVLQSVRRPSVLGTLASALAGAAPAAAATVPACSSCARDARHAESCSARGRPARLRWPPSLTPLARAAPTRTAVTAALAAEEEQHIVGEACWQKAA
jgi:hypothetical protein